MICRRQRLAWICSLCVDVKIRRCEDVRVLVARDRQGMLYRRILKIWKYKHTDMLIGSQTCLHKLLPSTTLHYKACTNYFPVLLCTAWLAQTTSQYYCVLQSLHKLLPSTTLHYKACTNYFLVLLCTIKLAQTTSQYYCVLQSLHKLLPSTKY